MTGAEGVLLVILVVVGWVLAATLVGAVRDRR